MYTTKNSGPKIDPWGIKFKDIIFSVITNNIAFVDIIGITYKVKNEKGPRLDPWGTLDVANMEHE